MTKRKLANDCAKLLTDYKKTNDVSYSINKIGGVSFFELYHPPSYLNQFDLDIFQYQVLRRDVWMF